MKRMGDKGKFEKRDKEEEKRKEREIKRKRKERERKGGKGKKMVKKGHHLRHRFVTRNECEMRSGWNGRSEERSKSLPSIPNGSGTLSFIISLSLYLFLCPLHPTFLLCKNGMDERNEKEFNFLEFLPRK